MKRSAGSRLFSVALTVGLMATGLGIVAQPSAQAASPRRAHAPAPEPATSAWPMGFIATVAGNGNPFSTGDDLPATTAEIKLPGSVAVDSSGNRLIGECAARVRMVAEHTGTYLGRAMKVRRIYTVAGSGTPGYSGDGGPALNAKIASCPHVGTDASGNLLIADTDNYRVRVVAASTATFYGIAMTAGNIYTIGGNGTQGASGDGQSATLAQVIPLSVNVDGSGNVLLTDGTVNSRVRVIASSTATFYGQAMIAGRIYTVAGSGQACPGAIGDGGSALAARLCAPQSVAPDHSGNVLIADTGNNRVRVVAATTGGFYGQGMTAGNIYTIAGNGTAAYAGDNLPATAAQLAPRDAEVDSFGNVIITDGANNRIRMIAEVPTLLYGVFVGPFNLGYIYTIAGTGASGFGNDNAPAFAAPLAGPGATAVGAGDNLVIADTGNNRVRALGNLAFGVSSASPNQLNQASTDATVTINGGAKYIAPTATISGDGLTSSVVGSTANSITLSVTVTRAATPGARDVTVDDVNGSVTCTACFTVVGIPPGAPVMRSVTIGNHSATVAFAPPPDAGLDITKYTVTATDSTTPANGGQVVNGAASPITVLGLTNGDKYKFTVTATTAAGTGPKSKKSKSVKPTSKPQPAPAITVVQSTTAKDFSAAGNSIPLGFLVTNSGNDTLSSIQVTDSGASVPCPATSLLAGAQMTCNANHSVTAAEVTSKLVTLSATASGTDYKPTTVTSSPSEITVPIKGASTPLLATRLCDFSAGRGACKSTMALGLDPTHATWGIDGASSSGSSLWSSAPCTTSSTPPDASAAMVPGVVCLGNTGGVLAIGVPTPTLQIPVTCPGGFPFPTSCTVQAYATQGPNDGTFSGAIGSPKLIDGSETCGGLLCGTVTVPLVAATQYVRFVASTSTGGIGFSPDLRVAVQPTALVQGDVIINRIVYQPPGGGSSQTYSSTQGFTTETDVSFGTTNSKTSELTHSGGLSTEFGANSPWFGFNMTKSNEYSNTTSTVNTQSNKSGTGQVISYEATESLTVSNPSTNPSAPPWMSDVFDLLVSPQFGVWDFSSCTAGVAVPTPVPGSNPPVNTTTCPGSTVVSRTGIAVVAVQNEASVSVGDPAQTGSLANCAVTPGGTMSLPGGVTIRQAQCRSILSMDPFAATGLGIIPTPAGSKPGQGVDPSLVLTGAHRTPFKSHTYTLPAGPNSQGPTMDTSEASSYNYSASSTMQTDITAMKANSLATTATAGIEYEGFGIHGSTTLQIGSSSTKGIGLSQTYTGSNALTTSQGSTTSATLADTANPISVTPYVDQRFSTFMFQSGTNQSFAVPAVSSVSSGAQSLSLGAPLTKGSKPSIVTVVAPHVALDVGQELVFADGETLVVSAPAAIGDPIVQIKSHKMASNKVQGAAISVPGFVTVHGSGLYGPLLVSFCTKLAQLPDCTQTTSVFAPGVGGDTVYVLAPPGKSGAQISVLVLSQSGTSPTAGTYTYP